MESHITCCIFAPCCCPEQDGVNGFSVPSADLEGYVVGLRKLVEDNDLRHRMSAKGREMALGYSTAEVYNGMLEIYRSSRDEQRRQFRDRKAQKTEKKAWPFWEAFGLVVRHQVRGDQGWGLSILFDTSTFDLGLVRLGLFREYGSRTRKMLLDQCRM